MGFDTCARIFLVIINIVFLIIGLALTAAGVILKFVPSLYEPYMKDFMDKIPSMSSGTGIDGVTQSSSDATFDIGSIFSYVGIGLLVFGIFICIIALLGLLGSCCKVKLLLIVYIILVSLLLLGKLAVLIIVVTGYFNNQIKEQLNSTLVNEFVGIDDFSVQSLSWNFAMTYYTCCGINGYRDFDYATKWNNNRTLTVSGYTAGIVMQTPAACCKTTGTFPAVTIVQENCTIYPSNDNNNWNTGCWVALEDRYNGQKTTIIGVVAAVLAFELICVIFAICILCRGDDDKGQVV